MITSICLSLFVRMMQPEQLRFLSEGKLDSVHVDVEHIVARYDYPSKYTIVPYISHNLSLGGLSLIITI